MTESCRIDKTALVMVGQSKRAEIRRTYRMWRVAAEKTQDQVTALARLDVGRYWKIENGQVFPTDDERKAIARVLRVSPDDLPAAQQQDPEARAS